MTTTEQPAPAVAGRGSRRGPDPRPEYRQRLESRRRELERRSAVEKRVSIGRLLTMVTTLVVAWLAIQDRLFSLWWALAPLALFVLLVVAHDRILARRARAERALRFYERGLARLDLHWEELGDGGERYRDPHHLYAEDLDLFGSGSLFQLLSTARTRVGQDRLAEWLRGGADIATVGERQEAVEELAPRLDLREDLALLGEDVASEVDPESLQAWAGAAPVFTSTGWRRVLPVVAGLNVLAVLGWAFAGWPASPLLALLLLESLAHLVLRRRIGGIVAGAERVGRDLALVGQLLARLEREPLSAPRLRGLLERLETSGAHPSSRVRRFERLVELLDSRRNPLFAPFAALLLWTTQIALAIEEWRQASGPAIERWLHVVGEVEALASLASHAFERPEDPFPVLLERAEPVFEGRSLGHPLVADESFVRNDLSLGPERRACVVSGSNMSGKSTFLRTCGINTVLALAGAPVRARELRLTPLALGASLRIHDSLQEGSSRFYAEITRLRKILDLTEGDRPVFFLLDEILHGTNSHDRRIGAEAVVRSLLERGAIGLVTTHDLALAEIAAQRAIPIENVHFEDHLEAGKMVFDYRLRPGTVTKSNALALMREVGLEV